MSSQPSLQPLFQPRSIAFVGGASIGPAIRHHRALGFAGRAWLVNPKYETFEGLDCVATPADLPEAPDLAFVGIRADAAIGVIAALRARGCRAVICHAAGFAELGENGRALHDAYLEAVGDMVAIGPNSFGMVNFADGAAALMDNLGTGRVAEGVALVSQGGGLLCDAAFCDRDLAFTHMVSVGNQAVTSVGACVDFLLDDPRVKAVGLAFEGMPDMGALRRAAVKALGLGKPIVALKFGTSAVGANASLSHTASMTGAGDAWRAVFDRLGIIEVASDGQLFETLKLFASGAVPKGRRVLVTTASGMMGIMLADRLSEAGFALPQPSTAAAGRARAHLPGVATPCNPQDITMVAWNAPDQQAAIFGALLDDGHYDIAMMIQNYPRAGQWDIGEYAAQLEALGRACAGRDVTGLQLAPLAECYPAAARAETRALGLVPMQGLAEALVALGAAADWHARAEALRAAGPERLEAVPAGPEESALQALDEAAAKARLAVAGLPVPEGRAVAARDAAAAAETVGFPVALKALDARLVHKTEAGAVRLGLRSTAEVEAALEAMRAEMALRAPDVALDRVLVEAMAPDVVAEVMASVTHDPVVGPVMMIAGGGTEAELWGDSTLVAFPVTRDEIERALDRLKVAARIAGWRGRPAGDRDALVDALLALARFAEAAAPELAEVEINPMLVGRTGVVAVDAVLTLAAPAARPAETALEGAR